MFTTVDVPARPLTAEAWAPFGWIPISDEDPADGAQTLTFEWEDAHVNLIHHKASEIEYTDGALLVDRMYRHATHTQTLLVLNEASVIAVAAPGSTFTEAADLRQISAFTVGPGDALVLHRNTWHWGPFPVSAERVDMFNVQGRRYAEDNTCQELTALGTVLCQPAHY